MLESRGLSWFNPDTLARALMAQTGIDQEEANGLAWARGKDALERAIANRTNYAFETTLGGTSITNLLAGASKTHSVIVVYCGLSSPALHIERIAQRVALGGHPIADAKVHERWKTSRMNLMRLLPKLDHLQVFDNSAAVRPGQAVPDPVLVLEWTKGRVVFPKAKNETALRAVPLWARPIVEAALQTEKPE